MKKLSSCILIEWKKLIKSKLSIVTACSICLVPFIVGLFATMMKYPENFKNLGLISAKMEMMRITDWSSYLMTISQVISVGGLLIFGFTASWVFGREYSPESCRASSSFIVMTSDLAMTSISKSQVWFIQKFIVSRITSLGRQDMPFRTESCVLG